MSRPAGRRRWPLALAACLVALSACASAPGGTAAHSPDDVADAYVAAVRHFAPGSHGYVLDPVVRVLYEQVRLASDPPDSIPHPPEVISRLMQSGVFTGVCEVRRALHEPAYPEGARMRVLFSEPMRVSADTLEFETAYATVRRPHDLFRGYGTSYWCRVVRVQGAWTVTETRQRSVT